ncbi:unnamed protein product [Caenorhabditis brenneri]
MSDRYKCKCPFSSAPNFKIVKDARNGIYKCERFAQHVERNNFSAIYIASIGGIWRWHFKCTLRIKNDQFLKERISIISDDCYYFDILKVAHFFNLSNVIHYCDRPYNGRYGYRFKSISFCTVVKSNLRHILAEKLRCRKQKEVVKIAKELDFKEATGETMKAFVAKILYN